MKTVKRRYPELRFLFLGSKLHSKRTIFYLVVARLLSKPTPKAIAYIKWARPLSSMPRARLVARLTPLSAGWAMFLWPRTSGLVSGYPKRGIRERYLNSRKSLRLLPRVDVATSPSAPQPSHVSCLPISLDPHLLLTASILADP